MTMILRCYAYFILSCVHSTFTQANVPINTEEVISPWPSFHAGPARQASTSLPGPGQGALFSKVNYFTNDTPDKVELGTSPWHILSDLRYEDDPATRTLWGASLQYIYKYKAKSDGLVYVDSYRLIRDSLGATPYITWNFVGLADGRFVVPLPNGLRRFGESCYGRDPALLVFRDSNSNIDSQIQCVHKFDFTEDRLNDACGFRTTSFSSFTFQAVLFSGDFVVKVIHSTNGRDELWLVVLDNNLRGIQTCKQVANGTSSNAFALEPTGTAGETRFYVATETEIIQVLYQAESNTLTRESAVEVQYRGRTGTTPTLLGFGSDDQWIITVDGRCYVEEPFTGTITCGGSSEPSSLIAIPRPLSRNGVGVRRINLPNFVNAVENSPAVAGNDIVVCSYSGFTADGEVDGNPDFALGIVKLSWNPSQDKFQIDWSNGDVQCSGIPTISTSSNLVYFSGSDPDDRQTYFRAARLNTDSGLPGGEILAQTVVGPSFGSDAVYDAGNSLLINDDDSAIFPAGQSLVHISAVEFPPTPSPPRICFSGEMRVTLVDGRQVTTKELQVGDVVQVSQDKFQPVYSLCKRNFVDPAAFLQIFVETIPDWPLEVSENHLVFFWNGLRQQAKAASDLRLGDTLILGDGGGAKVRMIRTVYRKGYFAPYTRSGTIVVNGLLVSSYASLPSDGFVEHLSKLFPMHYVYHVFQTHHRIVCQVNEGFCRDETYDNEGFSNNVKGTLDLYIAWRSVNSMVLRLLLALPCLTVLCILFTLERLWWPHSVNVVLVILVGMYFFRERQTPKKSGPSGARTVDHPRGYEMLLSDCNKLSY